MASGSVTVMGAGGHSKVVITTAEALGYQIAELLDDRDELWGSMVLGHSVTGPLRDPQDSGRAGSVVAIGKNMTRKDVALRIGGRWVVLIHPSAWTARSAEFGVGTVAFAHAVVQPGSSIGCHVIINTAATVDHDCVIGDFAHIAPGVHLGGGVRIGSECLIGIGSTIAPGVTIGDRAIVGAGAVVTKDVPPDTTVVGVPARPIRS